jgi:hypothetical protein
MGCRSGERPGGYFRSGADTCWWLFALWARLTSRLGAELWQIGDSVYSNQLTVLGIVSYNCE